MLVHGTKEVAFDFDHKRDQQIRAMCSLVQLYWQIEPEDTFGEIIEAVHWALDDPEGDYNHDDEDVYKQLYALYKQRGGDSDVEIGPFVAQASGSSDSERGG